MSIIWPRLRAEARRYIAHRPRCVVVSKSIFSILSGEYCLALEQTSKETRRPKIGQDERCPGRELGNSTESPLEMHEMGKSDDRTTRSCHSRMSTDALLASEH